MKRYSKHKDLIVDLAICAVLLFASWPPTFSSDPEIGTGSWIGALLLPTVIAPVLLRRRHILPAAFVYAVACLASGAPTFDQLRIPAVIATALVLGFTAGRSSSGRERISVICLLLLGISIDSFTEIVTPNVMAVIAFGWPLTLAATAAGALIGSRERLAIELEDASEELRRRRDDVAKLAVEIERARLASALDAAARKRVREIVELADRGAGTEAGEYAPGIARDSFARIEDLGRESLNSMRELLGVLRSDERARRAPGPTLEDLDALLADARRGGHRIELVVEGDRELLPGEVELAAYRTLQHALMTVRSSDASPATVLLRYLPDALELEVQGPPAHGANANAAIAAARERVKAHGGDFDTGSGQGNRDLLVRLPLEPAYA
ncbi:MAG: sensor histidine kinase [Solirubrobacterales bacterium]